jgi:mono/diheme cytochrome c family protein
MRRSFKLALLLAFAIAGAAALRSTTEAQVAAAAAPMALSGAQIFAAKCATCHQASGQGGGMFPALAGDKNVTAADPSGIIATVLHGRNLMPSWKGQLTAANVAAVLTYVRSSWGNSAAPVTDQDVAAVK